MSWEERDESRVELVVQKVFCSLSVAGFGGREQVKTMVREVAARRVASRQAVAAARWQSWESTRALGQD